MANDANLRPYTKEHPPTADEARENGRKGGQTRARNAKDKKAYAEHLRELLDLPMDASSKPRDFSRAKSAKNVKDHGITVEQATIQALVSKALKGDIRAIELMLKLTGQMPDDKHEVRVSAADPKQMSLEELAKKLTEEER